MHHFRYQGRELWCEHVPMDFLARKYGTPLYVYSQQTIEEHFHAFDRALSEVDHLICYAVKANANLGVLRTLADLGSGFDVVSAGELLRVAACGGDTKRCVFAGVGKTVHEIETALMRGVYAFNVESEPELARIQRVAEALKKTAPISLRVNPDVDANTHAKITTGTYENKFGIALEDVERLYAKAHRSASLRLRGLQMHIGSQLTKARPFKEALQKVLPLFQKLRKRFELEFLSIGGGMGIVYESALASGSIKWWQSPQARPVLTPAKYASHLIPLLKQVHAKILVEPGRFMVGNAGVLLTRVEYVKRTGHKRFIIVDAAMNDLIRPAFYDAFHEIVPLQKKAGKPVLSDVVGPICESGDCFCKGRLLPRVTQGDYLAILSAGAYGFAMASTYNSRTLAAEALVKNRRASLVRKRQEYQDLWSLESLPFGKSGRSRFAGRNRAQD